MQGLVTYLNKEFSRSMELYRKAMAIESTKRNREKGTLHEATVFTTMAHCCHMLGDIYEMEVYTNKVKEINSINYGSEFVLLTVSCQMLIGRSFYDELEFEVAQKLYEDSIDTVFHLPDFKDHQPFYYFNKWRLGCCLCRQSMFSEALNLFELSLRSNMFVSRTQSTVALWCGTCLNRMQCYHEAVQYLEESYVIRTTMLSEDLMTDPVAFDYFTTHGFATCVIGRYKESLESYDKLKTILLQRQAEHPKSRYEVRIASCQFHSAKVYYRLGNYEKAREITLLYLNILQRDEYKEENQKDQNDIFVRGCSKEIAFCHKLLGQCYYAESQFAEAAKEFKCEMNIREQITEKAIMDNGLAWCKFNLGKFYFGLRQHRLAAEQFEVAIEIWKYCDVNHLKSVRKIIRCAWWIKKSRSVANRSNSQ
uniref:DNA methyltransferase 1-associated protein 1-like n=1 Tax=Phallusia mammillata TaxID=59560 RepID=A0A6F9DAG7_9ASCI|nr:DNA methyltransferase 1-associated protein 1-like [Phallusia mammillata]